MSDRKKKKNASFIAIPGSKGRKGSIGIPGIVGPRGLVGPRGIVGPRGPDGIRGPRGADGQHGLNGSRGIMGIEGGRGKDGLKGENGVRGIQGEKGENGVRGPKGLNGNNGPKGDRGDLGPMGPRGSDGKDGPPGHRGPPGHQGLQGPPGLRGPPGEVIMSKSIDKINLNKTNLWKSRQKFTNTLELKASHFTGIACYKPGKTIVVGENGRILKIKTSHIKERESGYTTDLLDVHFKYGSTVGIAVGKKGIILKTVDTKKWKNIKISGCDMNINSAFVASENEYVIAGDNGVVYFTNNGGKTWEEKYTEIKNNLNAIYFFSPKNGYIVGDNGTILHTSDGGNRWHPMYSFTNENLRSIFFNGVMGYIVGDNGTILHSIDSGVKWENEDSGIKSDLTSVFNVAYQNWYACGDNGVVIVRESKKWLKSETNTYNNLTGIVKDKNKLIAIGAYTTILEKEEDSDYDSDDEDDFVKSTNNKEWKSIYNGKVFNIDNVPTWNVSGKLKNIRSIDSESGNKDNNRRILAQLIQDLINLGLLK
jgi:photosystem II stability/assembly factor-like uncharacterized protein